MKKLSKTEARDHIHEFFQDIKNKSPEEIRKVKRLEMHHKIPLKEKRKQFCKKCFSTYKKSKIRIRNKIKSITCENCGYVVRYRI